MLPLLVNKDVYKTEMGGDLWPMLQ